jgi:serine/threonine-protein kinase
MPADLTDHNLLFGILALQADFLNAQQFVDACSAWAARKVTPLADLLIERGWLTVEDRAAIDLLLERMLRRHSGDARAGLAAVTTAETRRTLCLLGDRAVEQSLSDLPREAGNSLVLALAYQPGGRQRYSLTRLHAQGGIGQVWLAHDQDLERDVALKELRPDWAESPAASARFLAEAKITGQLEHPGIVPVYELVQPKDGQPCYTMRFVGGRTLADAVRDYHHRRREGSAGPLDLRELLTAFVGVCNAVAYAHSRGVLHRDLKPHNVALGDFGEVLVIDWGLAKVLGKPEAQTSLPPVALGQAGSRDETRQGQVLGTPPYMAPEQAEGRVDLVDQRSDVYGLGAVLYEILTGGPPFTGTETTEVLRQVAQEPPVPPRQRVAATSAALQAVCLKALRKDPAARYESVPELGREVERFLAGEPVRAYREPLLQRLARWGRRHRTAVAGAGILLVTAVVGLTAGLVAVNAERRRTEQARAEEARRRQQARGALDAMSSQVIEDWLARQSELTDPQKRFLEKALASYQEFAQDTGQDEEARAGVARAYQRVGQIRYKLGQLAEARAASERGRELMAQLAADFPERSEYRETLGGLNTNLGTFAWTMGQMQEAESAYRAAIAVYRQLADDLPATPEYRQGLARATDNLGYALRGLGRRDEAEEAHRYAIAVRRQLLADFPTVSAHRGNLARSLNNLGNLLKDPKNLPEAEKAYREAIALQQQLVHDAPTVAENRHELATSYVNLGVLFQLTRRARESEEIYRKALALHEQLASDFPTVPMYREDLAVSHFNLANLMADAGRGRDAEPVFVAAIAVQQRLVADYPAVPEYRRALARTQAGLGELLLNLKRPKEAEPALAAARALHEKLLADSPSRADYHYGLAEVLTLTATLRRDQGALAKSLQALDEALPHFQPALRADPHHIAYRSTFRSYQATRVDVLLRQGNHAAAAAEAGQLLQDGADPVADSAEAACWLARCVVVGQKDERLSEARRQQLAKEYADRSLAALRRAVANGYKDVQRLRKDTDLDSLRSHQDFQKLLADVEARMKDNKGPRRDHFNLPNS